MTGPFVACPSESGSKLVIGGPRPSVEPTETAGAGAGPTGARLVPPLPEPTCAPEAADAAAGGVLHDARS